jgi:hypothetical protein
MKLTTPQLEILNSDKRFIVCAAGRRFGKSFASIAYLAKHARFPNRKCMYVAPTFSMCKQIIWEDLKALLLEKKWIKKINESELTITLINGSTIFLRSADSPDRIRGIGVDACVIDEAADIPRLNETWQAIIRPTLSDREGHALIIGSPKGRNFFYDMWNSKENDWQSLQYTTLEGGNVSAEEIESAKRDLDERTFKQEYMAEWIDFTGLIYYNMNDDNIVQRPKTDLPLIEIGMDFNIDPGAAVIGYRHLDTLHIFDEVEMYGTNTFEMVAEINRRYPHSRKNVYPDAAGAQRKTSAAHGITDHIILKNAGYKLTVGNQNPSVADRIAAVNSAFKSQDGITKLTIDPNCKKLLECLRKQTYKEGTRQPSKDGLDHFPDALGYAINSMFPIRQDIQTRGHAIRRNTGSNYRG